MGQYPLGVPGVQLPEGYAFAVRVGLVPLRGLMQTQKCGQMAQPRPIWGIRSASAAARKKKASNFSSDAFVSGYFTSRYAFPRRTCEMY